MYIYIETSASNRNMMGYYRLANDLPTHFVMGESSESMTMALPARLPFLWLAVDATKQVLVLYL